MWRHRRWDAPPNNNAPGSAWISSDLPQSFYSPHQSQGQRLPGARIERGPYAFASSQPAFIPGQNFCNADGSPRPGAVPEQFAVQGGSAIVYRHWYCHYWCCDCREWGGLSYSQSTEPGVGCHPKTGSIIPPLEGQWREFLHINTITYMWYRCKRCKNCAKLERRSAGRQPENLPGEKATISHMFGQSTEQAPPMYRGQSHQ